MEERLDIIIELLEQLVDKKTTNKMNSEDKLTTKEDLIKAAKDNN